MYLDTLPPAYLFFFTLFSMSLFSGTLASGNKPASVVAHFIVGNARSYTEDDWKNDIKLASANGIDAFALNIGGDSWERDQISMAFGACSDLKTDFKLFFSFDMSSLPCASTQDAKMIRDYIAEYHGHGSYYLFQSEMLVSTFSGEHCVFGMGDINSGWFSAVKSQFKDVFFMPYFSLDPSEFPGLTVTDGLFNWDSGWTKDDKDITFDSDTAYISNLGGKKYMAACSPWFFTHYGRDTYNKNWIYRSDDWLFAARWELLVENREQVDLVQLLTWNDYGESHYLGPIKGSQAGSEAWTTGYDHQSWLKFGSEYVSAFKSGHYSSFDYNRIYLWSRLFPAAADVPSDSVGKPDRWNLTKDFLWAVVCLKQPSMVSLVCGSSDLSWKLSSGVWKISLPLRENCQVEVQVSRNGKSVANFQPNGFVFNMNPSSYNFNALVADYDWS
ncbi:glycoside hydrolase family 71 protein [Armillaria luteobubalina]|uniref:Glycoside hydrolase family 71 protein n=1 Tax=Armillaria luteobubalina TaxID=153913 RepID=A0AA39UND9_9AGAR|nr:glycoside hydrolase family 71 protein [Armillaria luteobubalina]